MIKEGVIEVPGDFVVPDGRRQATRIVHAFDKSAQQTPSRDGLAAGAQDWDAVEEQISHLDR